MKENKAITQKNMKNVKSVPPNALRILSSNKIQKSMKLNILQYSHENTCVGVSFLNKNLLKGDSKTGVFLTILQDF